MVKTVLTCHTDGEQHFPSLKLQHSIKIKTKMKQTNKNDSWAPPHTLKSQVLKGWSRICIFNTSRAAISCQLKESEIYRTDLKSCPRMLTKGERRYNEKVVDVEGKVEIHLKNCIHFWKKNYNTWNRNSNQRNHWRQLFWNEKKKKKQHTCYKGLPCSTQNGRRAWSRFYLAVAVWWHSYIIHLERDSTWRFRILQGRWGCIFAMSFYP